MVHVDRANRQFERFLGGYRASESLGGNSEDYSRQEGELIATIFYDNERRLIEYEGQYSSSET